MNFKNSEINLKKIFNLNKIKNNFYVETISTYLSLGYIENNLLFNSVKIAIQYFTLGC